ncbi:MAG: hypothetical protein HC896_04680 [Bacteroidales bacterium]|nr:hypothetical protein [Bacteroidales bacterium]
MLKSLSKIRKFLWFALILFFFACKDDYDNVPVVPVDIRINLSLMQNLQPGQIATIRSNGKDGGLVVFNKNLSVNINDRVWGNGLYLYRVSFETYEAYDRTCTYQPVERYCATSYSQDSVLAICPCCKSTYYIENGGLRFTGPAPFDLRPLKARVDYGVLHITN